MSKKRTRRQTPDPAAPAPLAITLQESSKLSGFRENTLRDLHFRGHLDRIVLPGCRRWFFRRNDIIALVERHREKAV